MLKVISAGVVTDDAPVYPAVLDEPTESQPRLIRYA
jgi:hypothetical protein